MNGRLSAFSNLISGCGQAMKNTHTRRSDHSERFISAYGWQPATLVEAANGHPSEDGSPVASEGVEQGGRLVAAHLDMRSYRRTGSPGALSQNDTVPKAARGSSVGTISLPRGAMATAANLKFPSPSGMPMMVRQSRRPTTR